MIGGGDGVAALMLREIHRGVGDLNQFLRRRAVQRIAGDTEAGGDILLAQQGYRRKPSRAACWPVGGLLHGGFRHEDDEFVAAVAGNDVGAAAIRFENVADALQDEVAFEVAVEIVDEFEAVEVHQHQSKSAAGARRALPFGGKRFHEEAVGLDAGEAVGDGLFLGFLEAESALCSAPAIRSASVPQQQNFFFGEVDRARWIRRTERRAIVRRKKSAGRWRTTESGQQRLQVPSPRCWLAR